MNLKLPIHVHNINCYKLKTNITNTDKNKLIIQILSISKNLINSNQNERW